MKKLVYSFMALAAIFGAASCSNDDLGLSGETAKVTFTTNLEGEIGGRAYADGTTVDKLVFMAYDEDGNVVPGLTQKDVAIEGKKATVNVDLVTGKTYDFAFFAYKSGSNYYNLSDLKTVKVLNPTTYAGNEEGRDAFCAAVTGFKVTGSVNESVVLKRPFAQINVVTKDLAQASAAGFLAPAKVSMTVKNVCDTYNVITKDATGSNELTVAKNVIGTGEKITIAGTNYEQSSYLAMDYILVPANRSLVDCHIAIVDNNDKPVSDFDVPNAPVQANYRTNIIGNFFTNPGRFDIIVDNVFEGDENVAMWDGKAKAAPTLNASGEYEISSPAQLAGFAAEVNAGNKFEGRVVNLMADMSLNNQTWTPIGSVVTYPSGTFAGTFNGNGHTIYNLNAVASKVAVYETSGLFGSITGIVQNLTVKNAVVSSHHYAGVICGYSSANVGMKIDNCHVDGAVVVSSVESVNGAYDNGDKVGGIIGYCVSGNVVTGCSVKNATITAYRDLGGIVGCSGATISNNSVDGVTLIQNLENGYKTPAPSTIGGIIGRNLEATLSGNTEANVTIQSKVMDGLVIEKGEYIISTPKAFAYASANLFSKGGSFKLSTDINMNGVAYTPAELNSPAIELSIDGRGYTISNLNNPIGIGYGKYSAIIGRVLNGKAVVIGNLNIKDSKFIGVNNINGEYAVGAIIGWLESYGPVTIKNCNVSNCTFGPTKYVGGLVGYQSGNSALNINSCSVSATFASAYTENGTDYKGHCGGLVGYLTVGTINDCGVSISTFTVQGPRGGLILGTAQTGAVIGADNWVSGNSGLTGYVGSVDNRADKTTNISVR